MLVVFFRDEFCPESFLFISHSFCKLLSDSCFGNFHHITLKSPFKGNCSVDLSRSPIDLGVHGFQEGVAKEDVVIIYLCHKEGVLASVPFAAYFQDHYLGYFSCFVW